MFYSRCLGDYSYPEAVCGAGPEQEPAAAVRGLLPQRDPPLQGGQQDHLHIR